MKRLTILFDADDVVEDCTRTWVSLINERYGTNTRYEELRDWDVSLGFPTLTREQVYAIVAEDDIWHRISPLPGCKRILQKLYDQGHELYMVTATDYRSCRTKVEVLLDMFPFLNWQHIILAHNKQMIRGDILIDDGPHNLVGGHYNKLLFDQPHNRDFDEKAEGIRRVYSWEEIEKAIEALTAEDLNETTE